MNDFSIEEKRQIEARKMQVDWLKQLITVCAGSLVLSVAFVDDNNSLAWLFEISLISFVVSIIGCFGAIADCVMELEQGRYPRSSAWYYIALISAVGGFLVGIISLSFFAIANLS